ncbi:MAG TPA: hypothetical protein PLF16_02400 [Candidatus Staskawiczbacteria bacterium]|nr:hypothetical protein [Candidatus Staskawiczbacteria bacterium]
MDIFLTLLVVLFVFTAIFYVVYFSLTYYWHQTKMSFLVLPALATFEFFLIGFLVISLISILVNFMSQISGAGVSVWQSFWSALIPWQ